MLECREDVIDAFYKSTLFTGAELAGTQNKRSNRGYRRAKAPDRLASCDYSAIGSKLLAFNPVYQRNVLGRLLGWLIER
jgi:hypothetical protein